MKHDELIKVIDVYNDGKGDAFANALRAVVELHKPIKSYQHPAVYEKCLVCATFYPCPTIQAIKNELQ